MGSSCMKPATESWVGVAEIDFETALLAAGPPRRISESVCFHAQQCIEKYLKAVLQEQDRDVPRTHDLGLLLDLTNDWIPELAESRTEIEHVGSYAMTLRYPHGPIEFDELSELADDALRVMSDTRQLVRVNLEIEPEAELST